VPLTYQAEVLADSPYLYWRLGEASGTTAEDATANNRDGTIAGSPTMGASGALREDSNTAFDLDAVDDHVNSNVVVNTATVTVEVWFYYSGTVPSADARVAGFVDAPADGTHEKELYIDTAGKLRFYVYDGGPRYTSVPATSLSTGWNHLVGTADGTTARAYVNGVEVGSMAAGDTFTGYVNNNVFVGRDSTGSVVFARLAGKRDEFAVYTSALTAARIGAHYTAGILPSLFQPFVPMRVRS